MGSVAASVGGSLVSGYFANKAAKKQAGAIDRANQMNNMGYTDARPFINAGYQGGQDALNKMLSTGAYQGDLYANMNDMQNTGLNNQFNFGNTTFGYGQNLADQTQGFAGNYGNLYDQAMGGGAMNNALAYADANTGALTDAALRDSTRMLTEQTLPGINKVASGTGNVNSSRAGVADAIAMRDYGDRAADTAAGIRSNLIDQSLGQQQRDFGNAMSANQGLAGAFGTGVNTANTGLSNMINAGAGFQKDAQQQLNADKAAFEANRDFDMQAYQQYMSGILGRAPMSPSGYQANTVDPTAATISGMVTGAGMGRNLYNQFSGGFGGQPSAFASMAPQQQYINAPAYQGMGYMSGR